MRIAGGWPLNTDIHAFFCVGLLEDIIIQPVLLQQDPVHMTKPRLDVLWKYWFEIALGAEGFTVDEKLTNY